MKKVMILIEVFIGIVLLMFAFFFGVNYSEQVKEEMPFLFEEGKSILKEATTEKAETVEIKTEANIEEEIDAFLKTQEEKIQETEIMEMEELEEEGISGRDIEVFEEFEEFEEAVEGVKQEEKLEEVEEIKTMEEEAERIEELETMEEMKTTGVVGESIEEVTEELEEEIGESLNIQEQDITVPEGAEEIEENF